MKQTRDRFILSCFFLAIAATLIFTAGCGSVSGSTRPTPTANPSPSPTPAPSPSPTPSAAASFIYSAGGFESSDCFGGAVDPTGRVTPLGFQFADTGLGSATVFQAVAHPSGRFLYSLAVGAGQGGAAIGQPGIAEMEINSANGTLARIPGSPILFTEPHFGFLAMDPAGKFIYQPNNTGTFDIYSINQTTGALSLAGSSRAPSVGPFTAITSDGHFLINMGSNLIETLSIDAAGNLAVVQPTIVTGGAAPGVDGQLAVSADNRLVYVLNQGNVAIFHLDTHGMLAPVTGSPFATDARATAFSLAPDGLHLYVAFLNSNETAVKGFTFDPAAATLTPIAGAVITDNAATVTLDPSGRFAYIGHFPAVPGELSTYSVDPSTGALTLVSQTAQPIGGSSLTMVAVH